MKSYEHREKRERRRRAKVSVNNGQYKRLDQQIMISIHYANKKINKQAGFAVPHSSLTLGWFGVGVGLGWGWDLVGVRLALGWVWVRFGLRLKVVSGKIFVSQKKLWFKIKKSKKMLVPKKSVS